KVLVYEIFVIFVAALLRYKRFDLLAHFLSLEIFIPSQQQPQYVTYDYLRLYSSSLDELRNRRLHLNRLSVTSDLLRERYTTGALGQLLTWKEFMSADYLLYLRSALTHMTKEQQVAELLRKCWVPRSSLYLRSVPEYLSRAEHKLYFVKLKQVLGHPNRDDDDLKRAIASVYRNYQLFFGTGFY